MAKILFWASALIVVRAAVCEENNALPVLDPNEFWGPMELEGKQDSSIRKFHVEFEPKMIDDLKKNLKKHRNWTPPLEGVGFEYGFNSDELDGWLSYWADEYPFNEREIYFNQFPHFKTIIQGLDIHFIRVKPKVSTGIKILPLLLMHGWPSSVRDFYDVIPLLTNQTSGYDYVFEVIVPSLPGYVFSDAAVRPGLGGSRVAVIMRNLMKRLGFNKFYIHGGDWGSFIASAMVTLYPDDILGHHSSMLTVRDLSFNIKTLLEAYFPTLVVEPHLAPNLYPLSAVPVFMTEELGYLHLQSTKPDTIGVALTDSPVSLLAYMLEKFSSFNNYSFRLRKDGGLEIPFTKEQLIDNVMLYWSTNCITSSMRLYAESFSSKSKEIDLTSIKTPVPTWSLQVKYDVFYQPPELLRIKFPNLLNTTVLDEGGHYPALELPKIFAKDVFEAVNAFREWHGKNVKTEL